MSKTQFDFAAKLATPAGRAVFPKLIEADTKFDSGGVWQTRLAFDEEALEAVTAKAQEVMDAYIEACRNEEIKGWNAAKIKKYFDKDGNPKVVADFFHEETNQEGEETGFFTINFKRKATRKKDGKLIPNRAIKFFDANGTEFQPTAIWGGSTLKIGAELIPYSMDSTKTFGISFRVNAVQVIKLNSGAESSAADFGFGSEDGFTANSAPLGGDEDDDDPDF